MYVCLKFSLKCNHSNYLFYSFKCIRRVCPNLSSAPCFKGQRYSLNLNESLLSVYLSGEKLCICRSFKLAKITGSANPRTTKNIQSANRKSAKCHICGRSAIQKNFGRKFADLKFAELMALSVSGVCRKHVQNFCDIHQYFLRLLPL